MALTDSITAYWKMDVGSGTVPDATGSGFTLTNNNTVTFSTGLVNNTADFGTSNTNKSLSNSTAYETGSFSISAWFRLNAEIASGSFGVLSMHDNTTVLRNIQLVYNYNAGSQNLVVDYHKNNTSDNNITWASGALGTSAWTHVVITYNGTTITFYANDVSRGTPLSISGGGSGTVGTEGFNVGLASRYSAFGDVDVDEVGLWGRALTAAEVTELYNSGSGLAYPFTGVTFTPKILWVD